MYENALRAHRRQTQQENHRESAELYASFDEIACRHPFSWRHGETPRDAETIGTVTEKNRMICSPCEQLTRTIEEPKLTKIDPLLMNAFNNVNLAAACILTSVDRAESLGIPRNKWVYLLGGAGISDSDNGELEKPVKMLCLIYHVVWERSNFYSSPSLEQSLDAGLAASGLALEDVDCFDFYSYDAARPIISMR